MAVPHRLIAGVIALGLALAACGDNADEVVAEQSDASDQGAAEQDAPDADAAASESDASESESDVAPAAPGAGPSIDPRCESLTEPDEQVQSFDEPQPFCLDPSASYSATVVTNAGTITIDLDQVVAPVTVNNFVGLARNNYFDDTVCHRIIRDFVVQCGDPTATGTGGPGYSFTDELPAEHQYQVGSIAMANSGPDTNGSQFFIITGADGASLPPLYSLFGQVSEADLGTVSDMNARGSLDPSGVPSEELRIESVTITES